MTTKTHKVIEDGVAEKEEQLIKHLVDRFLGWRLPDDFHPDAGISFDPISSKGTEYEHKQEPTGTNLFTAEQAKRMFRFLLENEDGTSILTQLVKEERERVGEELMRRCEDMEQEHHYNTGGVDMDLIDRDTLKKHITNLTGVEDNQK